jgi:thiol-disulfide isomerase/thioredoxin
VKLLRFFIVVLLAFGSPLAQPSGLKVLDAKPAPALALQDMRGKTLDLSELRGQVVVVNFWASWCPPCRAEMPSLERLAGKMISEDLKIVGVNIGESQVDVEAFLKDVPVGFPVLLDSEGGTLKAWNVVAFPSTFLVDRVGMLRFGIYGGIEWDDPEVVALIRRLVKEK